MRINDPKIKSTGVAIFAIVIFTVLLFISPGLRQALGF